MPDQPAQHMQCMEVWGGSQLTSRCVEFGGLDAWVYSKPFGKAHAGGDIYYASSCATGRISRLLLADVAGHGKTVAATAADLRTLMRRFVNRLDQTEFVRLLNQQFAAAAAHRRFRHRHRHHVLRAQPPTDGLQRRSSAADALSRRAAPVGFSGRSGHGLAIRAQQHPARAFRRRRVRAIRYRTGAGRLPAQLSPTR